MVSITRLLVLPFLALSAATGSGLGSSPRRTPLLGLSRPDSKIARNVLEGKAEGYCSPSGPIESTHCAYETVEDVNKQLFPAIHDLVEHPFFKYYKVDLFRECPFWQENGLCMNRACAVEEATESDIPEKWRQQTLSQVKLSSIEDGITTCYFRDDDFCFLEDDATNEGQYIDLTLNPERFTGYAGDSARNVWRAIYQENCFGLSEAALDSGRGVSAGAKAPMAAAGVGPGAFSSARPSGWGFSKLSEGWGTEMAKTGQTLDLCEEKKLYYRVISGLHASISIHICADYLDKETGQWGPNLQCFIDRLATHPERLSNVYFNTVLMLRAVARAAPYFKAYDVGIAPRAGKGRASKKAESECTPAMRKSDAETRTAFDRVLAIAESAEIAHGFDEHEFFTGPDAPVLKEQFKSHFRNVSRIMDCTGCDKCRLWGKLQVSGIGTALKILFSHDEKSLDPKVNPDLLQRSEVVALFNALHRLSESLAAVDDFRKMYAKTQADESTQAAAKESARLQRALAAAAERKRREAELAARYTPAGMASALLAAVASAAEIVRRSCEGCLEACIRGLKEILGGTGKDEL